MARGSSNGGLAVVIDGSRLPGLHGHGVVPVMTDMQADEVDRSLATCRRLRRSNGTSIRRLEATRPHGTIGGRKDAASLEVAVVARSTPGVCSVQDDQIPGTREGIQAIEEAIFAWVPINVTLLLSPEQYVAAAEAYIRRIERRVAAGLNPHVTSVASLFVSRWDAAVAAKISAGLENQLGITVAKRTYKAYRDLLASDRWLRFLNVGARSQRLLWASTGTKDPKASDILYIKSLAAPHSVNTMPEKTLQALADHGDIGTMMRHDDGDAEQVLERFTQVGVDPDALAADLQREGAAALIRSWDELLACIAEESTKLKSSQT